MHPVIQEVIQGHRWLITGEVMEAVALLYQESQSDFFARQQEVIRNTQLQTQVDFLQDVIARERAKIDELEQSLQVLRAEALLRDNLQKEQPDREALLLENTQLREKIETAKRALE